MSEVVLTAIITIVTNIITGGVTWFLSKRKYDSEVDNNLIENMQKSLDFYKHLSDDNRARLEEVLRRNESLEKEVAQLRTQMFELMTSICYDVTCHLRQRQPKHKEEIKKSTKSQKGNGVISTEKVEKE